MRYGTGVALCLAAGTIWSLMGLGLRQIEAASVWQILFWRSVGMIPVLLGFMWWTSRGRPLAALRAVGLAGIAGGLGLVLAFAGAIYAFQTTTVANAVLLFAASPFVAAVLGWLILRESVRPMTWIAIAIAVFGMYLMVSDGLQTGAFAGNMAALLSAAGFGIFSVALRWGRLGDMMPVAFLGSVFSTLFAGAVLIFRGEPIPALPQDMAVAFAIGFFVVALGMVLFTLGSRVVPAAELTLLSLVEVLLGPIWVWLALGETASRNTLIGGGVLLAGVVFNAAMGARRPRNTGVAETS
ncbi:MAG: DMT family transporter [Tabrizicola sp.]|uniref:DMT family transporter n=1 Tax=Tabrizicola sp. TaxID=2005166 RepID=UPI002ABA8CDC|nr:DMT family transporter [Tabrizicola sp.]MDZ4089159.1 DMT family transporter [Tabrizicola sp.]